MKNVNLVASKLTGVKLPSYKDNEYARVREIWKTREGSAEISESTLVIFLMIIPALDHSTDRI